ncbi:MAG: M23 family metallopeptidase [Candidatus Dependentiae bacterium]|nr:M23 family metallopeptidase [Candidatus Dependentiae bacterium]
MENVIKNVYSHYIIAGIAAFFLLITVTGSLLCYEYFYFKRQAEQLLELKEEYRSYIVAVKKIVDDYNQLQEQVNSPQESNEKKKITTDQKESFTVVNRDKLYLKQSMVDFFGSQDVHFNALDWRDYNEQLIEYAANNNRNRTKNGKRRVASHAVNKLKSPMIDGKRDISLAWPIESSQFWLSSFFGPRKHPNGTWKFHHGIDMAALKGTPVKAAYTGMVIEARYGSGFGKTIVILHNNKYKTRYAHLNDILVKVGQKVRQGEVIGRVGDTGMVRSTQRRGDPSHLHFEIYKFGKRVNPMYYLA